MTDENGMLAICQHTIYLVDTAYRLFKIAVSDFVCFSLHRERRQIVHQPNLEELLSVEREIRELEKDVFSNSPSDPDFCDPWDP